MNHMSDKEFKAEMNRLRKQIDRADRALFAALAARARASAEIGALKRERGLPIVQLKRWREVVADRVKLARALGVGEPFARKLLALIHRESVRIQKSKKNTPKNTKVPRYE